MLPFLRGLPLTAMMFFVILPPFSSDTPLLYHFYETSRIRPSKDFNGQPRGNSCGRKFLHSYFQNGGSAKRNAPLIANASLCCLGSRKEI